MGWVTSRCEEFCWAANETQINANEGVTDLREFLGFCFPGWCYLAKPLLSKLGPSEFNEN